MNKNSKLYITNNNKANKVYDILMSLGGASENERQSFIYHHLKDDYPCEEWRFQGKLGFGGKYYNKTNRVSCYKEDLNEEIEVLMSKINRELSNLSH